MSLPSVMTHSFSRVPHAEIPRSTFDRSHGYKTTFDAGYLVPFFFDEALPGDTFSVNLHGFARLSTPLKPIMDNIFMDTQFFAVPCRLLWDNWQKFNGEQRNPADSTSYVVPTITSIAGQYAVGSIHDYLGLPIGLSNIVHSALFHRAYNLIWNEWYRDQNLQNSVATNTGDGPDNPSDYALLRRGKRHDYFTSCLPWPQKGTAVSLPLGTSAPVKANSAISNQTTGQAEAVIWRGITTGALVANREMGTGASGVGALNAVAFTPTGEPIYPSNLYADLSVATSATINALRQSIQIQKLYERDARGGTRYTEIVKSHFGVTSPDARLQRPEYLGGGSQMINVHPVAVTYTDRTNYLLSPPAGDLGAFATVNINGHGFTKSFTEHCIVLGLVSVRADMTYDRGLDRMFSRSTRWDFYWPALSQIGEQPVYNREIWAQSTAADANVFGYQERYAEYRYKPSKITGLFRTNAAGSLDLWHLCQEYGALPTLSSAFIVEDPPIDRVIAVPTEPHFFFDSFIKFIAARPMPVYGVPGHMDHF